MKKQIPVVNFIPLGKGRLCAVHQVPANVTSRQASQASQGEKWLKLTHMYTIAREGDVQRPQEMGAVWSAVVQEDYAWTVTCEKDYA